MEIVARWIVRGVFNVGAVKSAPILRVTWELVEFSTK